MLLLLEFLIYVLINIFIMSFFFPLPTSDSGTVRYRSVPYVTFALIFLNSIIFILWQAPELYQAETVEEYYPYAQKIWTYGFRSTFLQNGTSIGAFTTFSSIFMHADMWHLFGNMIFLWTFGRRVEDACGHWRYLLFYLLAGMIANLGSTVLNPSSVDLPGIGASGAISGVMGAYLIMFPGAKVSCLWFIGSLLRVPVAAVRGFPMWKWLVPLPAWTLLIYFLIRDAIPSLIVIQEGKDFGGVNNLAHLSGFLGALLIFLFVRKDLLLRYIDGRRL